MSIQEYWKMIPPEIVLSLLGTVLAGLGGAGFLFRSWVLTKIEKEKLYIKQEVDSTKAKQERDLLELQNELDQTQSSREMLRIQASENTETRRAFMELFQAMRDDGQKRDVQADKRLSEMIEISRGIQTNAAATLELLKEHRESDETMGIKQEKIIAQNDAQDRKLTEIQSELDTLLQKVESLTYSRATDSKAIHDILSSLEKVQSSVKHLEELSAAAVVEITPQSDIQALVQIERKEEKE